MLKIFSDIFLIEDFWEHVVIVFIHFIEPEKKKQKEEMQKKTNENKKIY